MNLSLLDPFENDFPEIIEECLDDGFATTCSFNRRGTLLAVGCSDGRCVIWDFDTRGVARTLSGHVRALTAVSWSRNGRKLLTSSNDWGVILWDVETSNKDVTINFGTMVLSAQMHPRQNKYCVVCPWTSAPFLIDLETSEKTLLENVKENESEVNASKSAKISHTSIAVFNKRGDKVFVGSSRGVISVFDTSTHEMEASIKVAGAAAIKSIQFSRAGKHFVVNSSDRVIRVFDAEALTCLREFQDYVNRMQWKKCCFSGDSDYIIGGSAQKAEHNIYIWNRAFGQLVKILEGPKEGIMDLVWHPLRPIIASCSTSGTVYIWAKNYTENWSAFAPDFKELEENEEYEEREDEFDNVPEDEKIKRKEEIEEEPVDIMTFDKTPGLGDSTDDEEDDLFFLPTVPEPDVPDDAHRDYSRYSRASVGPAQQDAGGGGNDHAASGDETNGQSEHRKKSSKSRKSADGADENGDESTSRKRKAV